MLEKTMNDYPPNCRIIHVFYTKVQLNATRDNDFCSSCSFIAYNLPHKQTTAEAHLTFDSRLFMIN